MGNSYAILIWDGWGAGLVRINPRLHTDGVDTHGYSRNSCPCSYDPDAEQLLRDRGLLVDGQHQDKYGHIPGGPMFMFLDLS